MDKYRIFETEQFQKDLRYLSRSGHKKVAQKLRDFIYPHLREHPHFGPNIKKLKDFTPETWRYRVGSWRFFYEIDEGEKVSSQAHPSPSTLMHSQKPPKRQSWSM